MGCAVGGAAHGLDHAVCHKQRHGDRDVDVALPAVAGSGRAVVLSTIVASTGARWSPRRGACCAWCRQSVRTWRTTAGGWICATASSTNRPCAHRHVPDAAHAQQAPARGTQLAAGAGDIVEQHHGAAGYRHTGSATSTSRRHGAALAHRVVSARDACAATRHPLFGPPRRGRQQRTGQLPRDPRPQQRRRPSAPRRGGRGHHSSSVATRCRWGSDGDHGVEPRRQQPAQVALGMTTSPGVEGDVLPHVRQVGADQRQLRGTQYARAAAASIQLGELSLGLLHARATAPRAAAKSGRQPQPRLAIGETGGARRARSASQRLGQVVQPVTLRRRRQHQAQERSPPRRIRAGQSARARRSHTRCPQRPLRRAEAESASKRACSRYSAWPASTLSPSRSAGRPGAGHLAARRSAARCAPGAGCRWRRRRRRVTPARRRPARRAPVAHAGPGPSMMGVHSAQRAPRVEECRRAMR